MRLEGHQGRNLYSNRKNSVPNEMSPCFFKGFSWGTPSVVDEAEREGGKITTVGQKCPLTLTLRVGEIWPVVMLLCFKYGRKLSSGVKNVSYVVEIDEKGWVSCLHGRRVQTVS